MSEDQRQQIPEETVENHPEIVLPDAVISNPTNEPEVPPRAASRRWWIPVLVFTVVLLAGAAFLGARLLNGSGAGGLDGLSLHTVGGNGGVFQSARSIELHITPAPEIPTRSADTTGLIMEVRDSAILVSAGGMIMFAMDEDGNSSIQTDENATEVEVVITRETTIYRDATFDDRSPMEEGEIQQVVEEQSLSELSKDTTVQVWGYKRGDRLVAEVILYTQPVMMRAPNP